MVKKNFGLHAEYNSISGQTKVNFCSYILIITLIMNTWLLKIDFNMYKKYASQVQTLKA